MCYSFCCQFSATMFPLNMAMAQHWGAISHKWPNVLKYDAADGHHIWERAVIPGPPYSIPSFAAAACPAVGDDDTLYVGTGNLAGGNGNIARLSRDTGIIRDFTLLHSTGPSSFNDMPTPAMGRFLGPAHMPGLNNSFTDFSFSQLGKGSDTFVGPAPGNSVWAQEKFPQTWTGGGIKFNSLLLSSNSPKRFFTVSPFVYSSGYMVDGTNTLWNTAGSNWRTVTFGDPFWNSFEGVSVDEDGDLYAIGFAASLGWRMMKFDKTTGNPAWLSGGSPHFINMFPTATGSANLQQFYQMVVDNNAIYICGLYSKPDGSNVGHVRKFSKTDGSTIWTTKCSTMRYAISMDSDPDGNVVITGPSTSHNPGTALFDEDGNQVWFSEHNKPHFEAIAGISVRFDSDATNVYVGTAPVSGN